MHKMHFKYLPNSLSSNNTTTLSPSLLLCSISVLMQYFYKVASN